MAPLKTSPERPSSQSVRKTRSQGSFYSTSPLAQAAVARDLEAEASGDVENALQDEDGEDSSDSDTLRRIGSGQSYGCSMVGSYRRPSFTAGGTRATVGTGLRGSSRPATKSERIEARREERSLLRDNNVIPPKHPQKGQGAHSFTRRIGQMLPAVGVPGGDRMVQSGDQEIIQDPSREPAETAPLLGNPELPYGGQDSPENIDKRWEEAVLEGRIKTTWQREAKVLGRYSAPLILTFLLQYSLIVTSVFVVGHIGKSELAAVSLAGMSANIFGYAIYQGLATSLDTLCAQAYGSGHKKLVGLQMQRMVYFLWVVTIPIIIIWLSAERILMRIVPEKEVARLSRRALQNWGPMIKLALPGFLMVEAEYFAFEILTLASSYFGTTHLAAQSVLSTILGITFCFPFPVSIAGSTRIANLIGATLSDAAKTSAKVTLGTAACVGACNCIIISSLRLHLPQLFTSDPEVIALVGKILPICAAFMLFDALAANCNGILRGLGRQEIGGWVQLFSYYAVAMPISMGTAFGLGWELQGLWSGVAIALALVAFIEATFLYRTSWERSVEEAKARNAIS
ncbi:MAG: hypothetical protein Q9191_004884 [Dirinaria sp. TL-2023a]